MNRARLQLLRARAYNDLAAAQSGVLVSIGSRLGLYDALGGRAMTLDELASATSTSARYLQPWLMNQLAAGYVSFDGERWSLDDEQRSLFANGGAFSRSFTLAAELTRHAPAIEEAMRTGGGFEHDDRMRQALAAASATRTEKILTWLSADRIDALERGVDVVDIGCGDGTLLRALAARFPSSCFLGIDIDEHFGFARELPAETRFDLILTVDTLHEVGNPRELMQRVRERLAENGAWLLVEPLAPQGPESPTATRFLSSMELLYCLPASLAHGAAGLGPQTHAEEWLAMLEQTGFKRLQRIEDADFLVVEARS